MEYATYAVGVTVLIAVLLMFLFFRKEHRKYKLAVRVQNEICVLLNTSEEHHLVTVDKYAQMHGLRITRFAVEGEEVSSAYPGTLAHLSVFIAEEHYEFLKTSSKWRVFSSTSQQKLAASR